MSPSDKVASILMQFQQLSPVEQSRLFAELGTTSFPSIDDVILFFGSIPSDQFQTALKKFQDDEVTEEQVDDYFDALSAVDRQEKLDERFGNYADDIVALDAEVDADVCKQRLKRMAQRIAKLRKDLRHAREQVAALMTQHFKQEVLRRPFRERGPYAKTQARDKRIIALRDKSRVPFELIGAELLKLDPNWGTATGEPLGANTVKAAYYRHRSK